MHFTIAILAGGHSRRMGRDKASLVMDGEALLARTARLARDVCDHVCVVGRPRPDDWAGPDVAFWPDTDAGQGPLGGLETALEHAGNRTVLLVACDLPLLTTDALAWLRGQGRDGEESGDSDGLGDGDGLVTVNDGQREPLFSLYAPSCLELVRSQKAAGRRSLQSLIDAGQFALIDAPSAVREALRDVDTPQQWAALSRP